MFLLLSARKKNIFPEEISPKETVPKKRHCLWNRPHTYALLLPQSVTWSVWKKNVLETWLLPSAPVLFPANVVASLLGHANVTHLCNFKDSIRYTSEERLPLPSYGGSTWHNLPTCTIWSREASFRLNARHSQHTQTNFVYVMVLSGRKCTYICTCWLRHRWCMTWVTLLTKQQAAPTRHQNMSKVKKCTYL